MANLTREYQLLKQELLGNNGYGNVYIRLYAKYNSQSIANNTSNISIQARLYNEATWYASSGTYYRITGSGNIDSGNISKLTTANNMWAKGEVTLGTQTKDIAHNEDGTRSIHAEVQFVSQPWGWNKTASVADVVIPTIKRYPILTSGEDFTDEGNPTLTFTNYGLFPVRVKLEAGGNNQLIVRDIGQNDTSFTFDLTEEERVKLRKLATTNTLPVIETVCAMDGETELNSSFKTYSMSIINGNPVFNNFEFADINEKTVELTGDDKSVILGYSNVKVTISTTDKAIAQKEATMNRYRFNSVDVEYSDTEEVSIVSNNVLNGDFIVYAIDSRGNSTQKIKNANNIISYNPLEKGNITASRENGVSETVILQLNGQLHNVNFGAKQNTIVSAQYRYKIAGETEWSEFENITVNVDDNGKISFSGAIKGDTEELGFNVKNAYNIEVYLKDELSEIKYTANFGAGIPHVAYAKDGISIMGAYNEKEGGPFQVEGKNVLKKEIMSIYGTDDATINFPNNYAEYKVIPFYEVLHKVGDGLTLEDNGIRIDCDVTAIKVSASVNCDMPAGSNFQVILKKNDETVVVSDTGMSSSSSGNARMINNNIVTRVTEAKKDDFIELVGAFSVGGDIRIRLSRSVLTVEVVK